MKKIVFIACAYLATNLLHASLEVSAILNIQQPSEGSAENLLLIKKAEGQPFPVNVIVRKGNEITGEPTDDISLTSDTLEKTETGKYVIKSMSEKSTKPTVKVSSSATGEYFVCFEEDAPKSGGVGARAVVATKINVKNAPNKSKSKL